MRTKTVSLLTEFFTASRSSLKLVRATLFTSFCVLSNYVCPGVAKTIEVDKLRFTDKDLAVVGTLEYGQFSIVRHNFERTLPSVCMNSIVQPHPLD